MLAKSRFPSLARGDRLRVPPRRGLTCLWTPWSTGTSNRSQNHWRVFPVLCNESHFHLIHVLLAPRRFWNIPSPWPVPDPTPQPAAAVLSSMIHRRVWAGSQNWSHCHPAMGTKPPLPIPDCSKPTQLLHKTELFSIFPFWWRWGNKLHYYFFWTYLSLKAFYLRLHLQSVCINKRKAC